MTDIVVDIPVRDQNLVTLRASALVDIFYTQTIGENNARLDGLSTVAELRKELKLIEAILLARVPN